MNIGYKGIANYYRISVSETFGIFQLENPDYIFIDVRNPEEWKKGIIPGALKINLENLEPKLKEFDKSLHYILVCHYGGRSSIAAKIMGDKGFPNVYNFQGGMMEWYGKKYPLVLTDKAD